MTSANLPPSPPPPPSPPSILASHSESSATVTTAALVPPQTQAQLNTATNENGTFNVDDEIKPQIANHFAVLDDPEHVQKYMKYEVNYTRRLLAKYFSNKNFCGGNVFEEKSTIDSEIILSSRWPCTRSFADPVHAFEDPSYGGPVFEPQTLTTLTNISNGKPPFKKNG